MREPPSAGRPTCGPVVSVVSNKGGVGKTTVAANLAIYLRALHEDLPLLVLSLDDQGVIDRLFAVHPPAPGEGNLKHGWAERTLESVIQLGQYGVHFVPSAGDVALLKDRAQDPGSLRRLLERTAWPGVTIVDTKSDLEALTRNAIAAADRIVAPVADWAALEEASKLFALAARGGGDPDRVRVLLTLVDRRTHVEDGEARLAERLRVEIARRGWPSYATALSRSPRVEALNSSNAQPLSILHHAQGTLVHREMQELAREIARELGLRLAPRPRPVPAVSLQAAWKTVLLRGWRRP